MPRPRQGLAAPAARRDCFGACAPNRPEGALRGALEDVAPPPVRARVCAPWLAPLLPEHTAGLARAMLRAGGLPLPGGLEISLRRDGDIWRLNRRWLGCDGPTNVLAFPPPEPGLPGSLLISVDTLRRECLLYGQAPVRHLARLMAHGLGHVLGFDHGEEMDSLCARLDAAAEEFFSRCAVL